MNMVAKRVLPPLLAFALAGINLGAAGAWAVDAAGAPDDLCDYCKDYTDVGVAAGDVRSTYRPGTGYARDPETAAAKGANGTSEEYKPRAQPVASEAQEVDKTRN